MLMNFDVITKNVQIPVIL